MKNIKNEVQTSDRDDPGFQLTSNSLQLPRSSLVSSDSEQVQIILRKQKVQTVTEHWLWFRFIF